MFGLSTAIIVIITAAALVGLWMLVAMMFRVVVPTNEVHIVQSKKSTVSYGKDMPTGNTYYKWPSWLPRWGVSTSVLPTAVFSVQLDGYAAYDKGRLPFMVDVMAFFRISDSNLAAQRVSNFAELKNQLVGILQGACRTILASSEIEIILEGRSQFGRQFTEEVDGNLSQWGVQTVKQIELIDMRDGPNSKVISAIMAKKSSDIDRESRERVAQNKRAAEVAEAVAAEAIGQRNAEKDKNIGIATELSKQAIQEEARVTMERTMAVKRVETVTEAEITKTAQIIAAEQAQREVIIGAEGEKQRLATVAEGKLIEAKMEAQGIEAKGLAEGAAQTALLVAPVDAQIKLAKEVVAHPEYQKYLIAVRNIEKDERVGIEGAKAAQDADIKVFATGGDTSSGIKNALELVSAKGGVNTGAMLEGFLATPAGAAVAQFLATLAAKKQEPRDVTSTDDAAH